MLFFYYGEDSFRAKQKIDAIAEKFAEQVDPSRHNIELLDGETIGPEDFFRCVSTIGFLASKKLIIIKNLLANKKLGEWQDVLLNFLDKQKDTAEENYIIFWETSRPDARLKMFKRLRQFKYCEEFMLLGATKLPAWIRQQAGNYNKKISEGALKLLINYVGNDLWQLHQEIHKLANYTAEAEIDETAVQNLVQAKVDDNIFALIDALGHKDKALALKLIEDKLNSGVNHQYILTMIVRQFRLIIKTKALEKQISQASTLAQTLKVHPLVAEKILTQSRYYNIEELKKIYEQLLNLDDCFKTSGHQEKILFAQMINQL
ncbi:MAG: DNA polymerase III subunit delta [Parcubacteria group bacterium]|nr:MAG: DNA polymerase III subunit delta [Parcubacteria group bacterium]